MKRIHFFKARSRLGLTSAPFRQIEQNIGVEEAPDQLLSPKFLAQFPDYQVDEFNFPLPEDVKEEEYEQILAQKLIEFKNFINEKLQPGETPVVVGGENSVTFSSFLAALERAKNPDKVAYIQFDSHGEMNKFATSPTKNFHGMYMRPFLDEFDIPAINDLVPRKTLTGENTLFIGNLDLDPEEKEFFNKKAFRNINRADLQKNKARVLEEIGKFAKKFDSIHINFDVDIFDKSLVTATGIPAQKGFFMSDIVPILEILAPYPISFDISEVNPGKPGGSETIDIAQKVAYIICDSRPRHKRLLHS